MQEQVADASPIQSLLQAGVTHHQAGRLQEADAQYRQILQREPHNPDALHLTGLIAHQGGKHQDAIDLIGQAIGIQANAVMHCNLGLAYDALHNSDGAVESFRQAIALQPNYIDAWVNLGASYKEQGKLDDAVASYRKALALKSDIPEIYFNLGVALQKQGKLDDAITHYRQAIALKPGFVMAYLNLGAILKEQGKRDEAIEQYRKAIALQPNYAEAHYNLALVLQGHDRLDEEIALYRKVLALRPKHAAAHSNLGNALKAQGKVDEAAEQYRQALAIRPDYAEAHFNLGMLLQEQYNFDEAVSHYRKALAAKPDYAEAHFKLGFVFHTLKKLDEAIGHYRQTIALRPDDVDFYRYLANALRGQGKLDEAILHYRYIIAHRPQDAETYGNLGVALRSQGILKEAIEALEQARSLQPDNIKVHETLAAIHIDYGQFDQAREVLSRIREIDSGNVRAWSLLVKLRKMTDDDHDWLKTALELVEQGKFETPADEMALWYAIGKFYDDTRQYDAAFSAYQRANTLKQQQKSAFGRAALTRLVDALIHTYTADFIRQQHEGASLSERPVFIVGMPRSGTSLVEQIIASHPDTFGAGELIFWTNQSNNNLPIELSGRYESAFVKKIADDYERLLQQFSTAASRVVDKMPGNFWRLGFISAIFPHSRIIHTQRNPIDTCLSMYFQNFDGSHGYISDLNDLAFYYREYRRIMAHWRSVLPPERFLDVPYEALTADQEVWSRRIVAFLGLEWNQRCLDFHETERKVGTASNWQVRQRIYQTSKERWHHYEKHVGPLLGLLDEAHLDDGQVRA